MLISSALWSCCIYFVLLLYTVSVAASENNNDFKFKLKKGPPEIIYYNLAHTSAVLYAFRAAEYFSSGMYSLEAYKQNLGTAIIHFDVGGGGHMATPIYDRQIFDWQICISASEGRRRLRQRLECPQYAHLYTHLTKL